MIKRWTVVVPIYNDRKSLEILLQEIEKSDFSEGTFLIVDNGSTDDSVLSQNLPSISNVLFLRTEKNLGFGGGIKFGLENATTEWVGWMPGNLKVHPSRLTVFDPIILSDNFDLIKAKRVGRSRQANFKTLLAGIIQSLILRCNMLDTGGTPTFIRRDYLEKLSNAPDDYVFESYVLYIARKLNFRISRPKVEYGERLFGQSHWQRGVNAEINLMRNIVRQSKTWK